MWPFSSPVRWQDITCRIKGKKMVFMIRLTGKQAEIAAGRLLLLNKTRDQDPKDIRWWQNLKFIPEESLLIYEVPEKDEDTDVETSFHEVHKLFVRTVQ